MSVVVAVRDGDAVYVSCDSQVSYSGNKETIKNKNNFKIFKPCSDKKLIMGLVGSMRDANILSVVETYIDELSALKNEINFKYIVTNVVPKLFKILGENNRLSKTNELYNRMNNTILFVYNKDIYLIDGDGCVMQCEDYCAIGSGTDLCYGYLNISNESDKKKLSIDAVKSACKRDLYVNFPIITMNTQNEEIEITEEY